MSNSVINCESNAHNALSNSYMNYQGNIVHILIGTLIITYYVSCTMYINRELLKGSDYTLTKLAQNQTFVHLFNVRT